MQLLGSIVFTVLLFVSVVPFSIAAILARPFGADASYAVAMVWAHTILWLCKVLCGLHYAVEGREHIPDRNCVVFLKHSSAYETIAQWVLFPRQTWVLKRELMWAPFLGWALFCLSPIAINRGAGRAAVEQVLQQGTTRLRDGLWVMIFPEGTRVRAGESRRYGVSGTLLAQQSNTVILPIAHDAGDYWPRRGLRKRPGTIRFVIGPAVDPAGREPREVNAQIQAWVEATIDGLQHTRHAADSNH